MGGEGARQATEVLRQAQEIRGGIPKAVIVLSMVGKKLPIDAGHERRGKLQLNLPLASDRHDSTQ